MEVKTIFNSLKNVEDFIKDQTVKVELQFDEYFIESVDRKTLINTVYDKFARVFGKACVDRLKYKETIDTLTRTATYKSELIVLTREELNDIVNYFASYTQATQFLSNPEIRTNENV